MGYNCSESSILYSNCMAPSWYESEYNNGWDETLNFWYLGKQQSIFTTDASCYGYRIVMKRTSQTTLTTQSMKYSRWLVGSSDMLYKCQNASNYDGVSATNNAFWIETNNAVVQIKFAPLFMFTDVGSYNINCKYDFTIVGYRTKAEYTSAMNGIQQELQNQTQEMEQQTEEMQQQTEELKEQTNTQKGMLSKITEFFNGFFDNLVNSVIGLFVPSSEELGSIFQQFDDFFSRKFGFLYFPIDVLTDFVTIMAKDSNECSLTFPGFSVMGYTVWEPITYDLSENPIVMDVSSACQMVSGIAIIFWFIGYVDKKFNSITRG